MGRVTDENGVVSWWFWCPGCKTHHSFTTERPASGPGSEGPMWTRSGTDEAPTFRPSLLYPHRLSRCHLYLTDGIVRYLSDCVHDLAGQSLPLESPRFR